MLVLKNNKGTEETRIRQMDYGVQFNKLFYERLITGGNITLFSPHDLPEMYEAFFNDQPKFKMLYEAAEQNPKLRKKVVSAMDLFGKFMQERKDTGRIYLMNVDNVNTHSSFIESDAPIRQSNLCLEIGLPCRPMGSTKTTTVSVEKTNFPTFMSDAAANDRKIKRVLGETPDNYELEVEDDDSRIAICTLSAINWGNIKQPSDFEKPCRLAVRALDALLSYQDYPVRAARMATMEHRPLGVGIINLAYWLARNNLKYSDGSALAKLDEYAEAWSYYLIRASVDLAKEIGPCDRPQDTNYAQGIMPIDTRKREVDALVPHVERMPWAELREDAKKYGIRNATLMALMPSECQAWSNKLNMADGSRPNFHELLEVQNIDWREIEASGIPQRYAFPKSVGIMTAAGDKIAHEFYYNGVKELYEVEFEDGLIASFTEDHLLAVERDGHQSWVRVGDIIAGDIVSQPK